MKYEILKDKNLALFFTVGVSLKTWHDIGMIDREVAIYNELSKYFRHIYFFTYGGKEDLQYKSYLADNITVIPQKLIKQSFIYSLFLPFIHHRVLKKVDIIKTNQMPGAWSALLAKMLYRKKLVARTGYMWSLNFERETNGSRKSTFIKGLEKLVYKKANGIITSSRRNFTYVEEKYRPVSSHIIIPNYIETKIFKPLNRPKKKNSICFVGRLSQEKNLLNLLNALKMLPCTINIIGSGPQLYELQKFSSKHNINANFLGNIPNHQLPEILNEHEIFILPSLWENMPKALLEAMACGLPVIGTNVEGIKEVIKHGENGILCETNSESMREAILNLMENEELKKKISKNARRTIEEHFSLDSIMKKELELYLKLLEK